MAFLNSPAGKSLLMAGGMALAGLSAGLKGEYVKGSGDTQSQALAAQINSSMRQLDSISSGTNAGTTTKVSNDAGSGKKGAISDSVTAGHGNEKSYVQSLKNSESSCEEYKSGKSGSAASNPLVGLLNDTLKSVGGNLSMLQQMANSPGFVKKLGEDAEKLVAGGQNAAIAQTPINSAPGIPQSPQDVADAHGGNVAAVDQSPVAGGVRNIIGAADGAYQTRGGKVDATMRQLDNNQVERTKRGNDIWSAVQSRGPGSTMTPETFAAHSSNDLQYLSGQINHEQWQGRSNQISGKSPDQVNSDWVNKIPKN